MRSINFFSVLLSLILSLGCAEKALAFGLAVDPGEIVLTDVPLGEKIAVSEFGGKWLKLKIHNQSAVDYEYEISIRHTENPADLKPGFGDIPDTSWIKPQNQLVLVAAGAAQDQELYLQLPAQDEYYAKNYQAIIDVRNRSRQASETVILACQLRFCFTTVYPQEVDLNSLPAQAEARPSADPSQATVIIPDQDWQGRLSLLPALRREFPGVKVSVEDYTQEQTRQLVEALSLDFLPAYLLSKDVENNLKFAFLLKMNILRALGNKYYLYGSTQPSGFFLNREKITRQLDLFIMSECPAGIQAVNELIASQEAGDLAKQLNLKFHYLASEAEPCPACPPNQEQPQFSSLHGESEVAEDIRQLCIQRFFPEKLLKYLKLRNQDIKNPDWGASAAAAGINPQQLEQYVQEQGQELLSQDIRLGRQLQIMLSPSFLYENQQLFSGFEQLKPALKQR